MLLFTTWYAPSDARCLSWLWLTSFPLLPKAGRAAADRSSSMGEGVRPGVKYSHHRRGHRGGRLSAAHCHCWTHRSNTPPSSHAFLCILSHHCYWTIHHFTDDYWDNCSDCWKLKMWFSFAPRCCTFVSLTFLSVHGYTCHRFPLPIWNFLFLLGNESWAAGEEHLASNIYGRMNKYF